MRTQSRHPWLNIVEYPFPTWEFATDDGWQSYVDVGSGRPVIFAHGAPSWSFLYRHLIRDLRSDRRCIAPDHLGFGLSEKPIRADYSLPAQARRFAALMDHVRVDDATVVVQDAGGPIALSWAIQNPGRVREIVIFNTWMWSLRDNRPSQRLANLVGNPFNRFYYRVLNASPSFIMPALFADRHRIRKSTQIQYLEPFRPFRERRGIYRMIEGLRQDEAWFEGLWAQREAISSIPVLFLWGTKDPLYGTDCLERWQNAMRRSQTITFPETGRFVPEEAPRKSIKEMRRFMTGVESNRSLV